MLFVAFPSPSEKDQLPGHPFSYLPNYQIVNYAMSLLQKMVAKMNLSYYEKSNLPKQNNMIVHLLGCNGERLCFAGNSAKEEVKWKEKAHDECKVKMDEF